MDVTLPGSSVAAGVAAIVAALVWAIRTMTVRHLATLDAVLATQDRILLAQDAILAQLRAIDATADARKAGAVHEIGEALSVKLDLDRRLRSIEEAVSRRDTPVDAARVVGSGA